MDEMDSVPSVREETRGFAHREDEQEAGLYIPACISERQSAKGEEREMKKRERDHERQQLLNLHTMYIIEG